LLLKYDGTDERQVGKLLTAFFIKESGWNVTITGVRSMVETLMHKKMLQGKVTPEQRNAVMNINGHTSATTTAHYILENRTADVRNARQAFAAAMSEEADEHDQEQNMEYDEQEGLDEEQQDGAHDDQAVWEEQEESYDHEERDDNTNNTSGTDGDRHAAHAAGYNSSNGSRLPSASNNVFNSPFTAPFTAPIVQDWGKDHPDYKSTSSRAQWTAAEKHYVGTWCRAFKAEYPNIVNVVAKCLTHMRTDPVALRIFHKHHVLKSDRLRFGYESFEKELGGK
jgi:cobalamin biosynthesis protein CobT